jgi:hypothetical protein
VQQSKLHSTLEAVTNTIGGILLAVYVAQPIVFSFYGIQMSTADNFGIAISFTAFSFARSYIVRRVFNKLT